MCEAIICITSKFVNIICYTLAIVGDKSISICWQIYIFFAKGVFKLLLRDQCKNVHASFTRIYIRYYEKQLGEAEAALIEGKNKKLKEKQTVTNQ